MRTQIAAKWPDSVTGRLDLVLPDASIPATGKSDVEGMFDPPYYEWYQYDDVLGDYRNLDAAIERIENLMIDQGPFDALMGFSQGAILSAGLIGLQRKGLALTRVPRLKFVVIISGSKFMGRIMAAKTFSAPKIDCPSLHFLGDLDFLMKGGEDLLECFVEPVVIRHPKGHTIPRLNVEDLETFESFLKNMDNILARVDLSPSL